MLVLFRQGCHGRTDSRLLYPTWMQNRPYLSHTDLSSRQSSCSASRLARYHSFLSAEILFQYRGRPQKSIFNIAAVRKTKNPNNDFYIFCVKLGSAVISRQILLVFSRIPLTVTVSVLASAPQLQSSKNDLLHCTHRGRRQSWTFSQVCTLLAVCTTLA